MLEENVLERTRFRSSAPGRVCHCLMTVFTDGSIYLEGDEIEVGFEFLNDARDEALRYLAEQGYSRCDDHAKPTGP